MDSTAFWTWVFGFASLASLVFAVCVYFKSREYIYPLIEKLRAARNDFVKINNIANRIVRIADSKEPSADDKMKEVRVLARTISENMNSCVNTIDDGNDWAKMNTKAVYNSLK